MDCGRRRLVRFFAKAKSRKDGLQGVCKDCGKIKSKDYYRRNTERHKKKCAKINQRARARNREFTYKFLLEHPCVDCGQTNPLVLQFDHVRGIKTRAVANLVGRACSINRITEEIEKCDVRCANCHSTKTLLGISDFWKSAYEVWQLTKGCSGMLDASSPCPRCGGEESLSKVSGGDADDVICSACNWPAPE